MPINFSPPSPYPVTQYNGTEQGAQYFEDREVNGVMYRVQNATFNTTGQAWLPIDISKPVTGFQFSNGVLSLLTAPAGVSPIYSFALSIVGTISGLPAVIGPGSIGTVQLADGSVTSAKLGPSVGVKTLVLSTTGVGASNTNTAIVDRMPLPFNLVVASIAIVGAAITTTSTFNIVVGEIAETGAAPGGAFATAGMSVFTIDPALPAAGVVQTYTPTNPTAIYSAGTELTLRLTTPPAGGLSGLKVVINGV